ncbi:MAG: lysophospholipid acyltransferase family protein [Myxococcota bacterium]
MRKRIATALLGLVGWATEGELPPFKKAVVIAAPHTTNWDGIFLVLVANAMGARFAWIGKDSLFRGPFGWIFYRMNGVPIDRRGRQSMVEQMAAHFESRDELLLAIAPEGTRKLRPHWRSGFYHIATTAKVPIVCGYLDYKRRRGGIGPTIHPTGNPIEDMGRIREFYADITGKYPNDFGPIRLKEEIE